jgi:two-component system, response regulator PdtaR
MQPLEEPLKFKVLIVEDESIIAEDMKETFVNWGFDVVGVIPNGRAALLVAKDAHPDLLVLDVKIGGDLNGVETAIVIRSFFETELPIIFISGRPATDYPILNALDSYIYLSKPLNSESLLHAMNSINIPCGRVPQEVLMN